MRREGAGGLIAATTTAKGPTAKAPLELGTLLAGAKVPEEELAKVNLEGDDFHGGWNYSIASPPGTDS